MEAVPMNRKMQVVLFISLILALSSMTLSVEIYQQSIKRVEMQSFEKYHFMMNYYNEKIKASLIEEEMKIKKLALQLATADKSIEEIRTLIGQIQEQDGSNTRGIFVFLENGQSVYSKNYDMPPNYEPRRREWYKNSIYSTDAVYTDVYQSIKGDTSFVSIGQRIIANGQIKGVICSDIRLDTLFKKVKEVKFGKTGYAFILSKNGNFLSHPVLKPSDNIKAIDKGAFISLLEEAQQDGECFQRIYYNGKENLYGAEQIGNSGWILIASIDDDELLEGAYAHATILALGTFILCMASYTVILLILLKFTETSIKTKNS